MLGDRKVRGETCNTRHSPCQIRHLNIILLTRKTTNNNRLAIGYPGPNHMKPIGAFFCLLLHNFSNQHASPEAKLRNMEPLPHFFLFLDRGLFSLVNLAINSIRSFYLKPHGDDSKKAEKANDRWSKTDLLAVGGPDLPCALPSPTSAKDQEQYQFE